VGRESAANEVLGYVFAFHADKGKACVAEIMLELDMVTAVYNYTSADFKEQVVEEYVRPDEPKKQADRKAKLRRSNLGFYMWLRGLNANGYCGSTYIHGPPLRQEEFRSSLQNLVESFRRSQSTPECYAVRLSAGFHPSP
jgi:hypothetical protein